MKLSKKVLLVNVVLGLSLMSPVMLLAEDTGSASTTPATIPVGKTAPIKDIRTENKEKRETLHAENRTKIEAAKTEAKAKREEDKKTKEVFALKQAQEKFAKAIADAEAGIASATAKLAEAKSAAAAATDMKTFEAARKLFIEARKIVEKSMRPLLSTPRIENSMTEKLPESTSTTTNTGTNR